MKWKTQLWHNCDEYRLPSTTMLLKEFVSKILEKRHVRSHGSIRDAGHEEAVDLRHRISIDA